MPKKSRDIPLSGDEGALLRESAPATRRSPHDQATVLPDAGSRDNPPAIASPDAKLLLTVPEAAACLSVSRAHLYRLLQAGELRAVHSRGATRLPYSELARYVALLISEGR